MAEYYGVYDYRQLPVTTVAVLVFGLRDDSRLVQKDSGVKASQEELLLAHIADRLSLILKMWGAKCEFDSLLELLSDREKEKPLMSFDSGEDFRAYWDRINSEG